MTDGETTLRCERAGNYLLISSEGDAPAFASGVWPGGAALQGRCLVSSGICLVEKDKGRFPPSMGFVVSEEIVRSFR